MRSALCWAVAVALAPAGRVEADPDYARATELYKAANAELDAGQFAEAARDYGAAYDITKDPVLFFKIGSANEKAGRCDVALIYYGRYVKEAKPDAKFQAMVDERIAACGGDARAAAPAAEPKPAPKPEPEPKPEPKPEPASPKPATPVTIERHGRDGAWLMVGGALALATAGGVLAYSATSSEQDLKDLYVGVNGMTPTFDATTQKRYNDLIDEGHRYQYLSWTAFGLAGACAIGATIWFLRSGDERVTPSPGGVAIRF